MKHIDTSLLDQYKEMLGPNGLEESVLTFRELVPSYVAELETLIAARDETGVRRQGHKMKGACRSLGFIRLANTMEMLEKSDWVWGDAEQVLKEWPPQLAADLEDVEAWLKS
ncbi:MAG: Hpt domain-containing protein [Idiomarina sp.]|nr:Hpt domain-containing protein [Idiomarina sp.]